MTFSQRLEDLLIELYSNQMDIEMPVRKARIEGFMEAGMITSVTSGDELEAIINRAYKSVHGIDFKDRDQKLTSDQLDIPTYLREKKYR